MRIRYDKIDGFIKIHNKIRYLRSFNEWWDKVCDRTKYLISKKTGITDSINHNFATVRIDSYDYLPFQKILTLHNVIILIKSIVNKYKNNYFYNKFLEKGSHKDKTSTKLF